MYTVVCDDREGNQRRRDFATLEEADLEYSYVNGIYDGAEILDEHGDPVGMYYAEE